MSRSGLPIGCSVRIEKPDLQAVIDRLMELGYRVIGPKVLESAVVLGEIASLQELPIGYVDRGKTRGHTGSPRTGPAPISITSSGPTRSRSSCSRPKPP